jgi:deoxyribonuclease-4
MGTANKKKSGLLVGAHVSASNGIGSSFGHAAELEANCMQIFTANQMQWHPKAPSASDIENFRNLRLTSEVRVVMSHDSYLINLCSPDVKIRRQSITAFIAEIERCIMLGVDLLNFHPGSSKEQSAAWGIGKIIEALNEVRPIYRGSGLRLLLESTAGQGSSIGWRFEELAEIIAGVQDNVDLGVCVDTCHIFAAGYDIRTPATWEETWGVFERILGFKLLHAVHVNDSKKACASRVDRHAELGEGLIGKEAFRLLVNDPRFNGLPLILETPGGMAGFKREIAWLRSLRNNAP